MFPRFLFSTADLVGWSAALVGLPVRAQEWFPMAPGTGLAYEVAAKTMALPPGLLQAMGKGEDADLVAYPHQLASRPRPAVVLS